jgi:hypothetical protein
VWVQGSGEPQVCTDDEMMDPVNWMTAACRRTTPKRDSAHLFPVKNVLCEPWETSDLRRNETMGGRQTLSVSARRTRDAPFCQFYTLTVRNDTGPKAWGAPGLFATPIGSTWNAQYSHTASSAPVCIQPSHLLHQLRILYLDR